MYRFQNCRPVWALIVLFALLKSAAADTQTWIGNAHDVKQIDTITVAGTWAANDTVTLTINGKDIVVTIGSEVTTTQVASAIKNAWNASARLDGSGSPNASSNAGGQEFGEFSEAVATSSSSIVTITANTSGKPFTLAVTEATVGDGTATEATSQAATGKHFWNNLDNWDTGAAPVNDDVLVFRDSNVSCKYGLPNGSLEVTIQQYQTYTGELGLPRVNVDNQPKPYFEYRQRYVRLDDAGGGTDIAHRFGIGQGGTGSPLINLRHTAVKCSPVVYNTGTPLGNRPGTKALNICATVNTSTLNILNGSVDFSSQDSQTTAFVIVNQALGDSSGIDGLYTVGAVAQVSGGRMLIGGSGAIATIYARGGTLRLQNQTGTITTLQIHGPGVVEYESTATLATLYLFSGGTFDARPAQAAFTVSNAGVYQGAKYLDPYARTVAPTNFFLYTDPSDSLQFGASITGGIQIVP